MKSLPLAAKVGSAGVLGGGGIAGTGLLIHDRIQKSKTASSEQAETVSNKESEEIYKLTDVDNKLIMKNEITFIWDTNFSFDDSQKTVTIKAKTTPENKTENSWTCTVKGVVSGEETVSFNGNFEQNQKDKFVNKLNEETVKKQNKDGFIKSCARNRSEKPESSATEWSSDLILPLTKSGNKYEFSQESINSIFAGTWDNSKQQ